MVKDHSDSEKGNLLPPGRLLLSIINKGSFICTIPDRITHTTAFVTPVVVHWLEREIAQWIHPKEGSIRRPIEKGVKPFCQNFSHRQVVIGVSKWTTYLLLLLCSTSVIVRLLLVLVSG